MVAGLPLHPLVVHFVVVLVPLTFIGLVAVMAVRKWRKAYAILPVAASVGAAITAVVAKFAGGNLAQMQGGVAKAHANYGNTLMYAAIVTAVLAVAWFVVSKKVGSTEAEVATLNPKVEGLGWLTVAVAAVATVFVMLAGHTGAESVWGGVGGKPAKVQQSTAPATNASAAPSAPASPAPVASVAPSTQAAAAIYTMEEVAKHATSNDCWAVIDGHVYDLTQWVAKHPGGAGAIEAICGKDGSAKFGGKHGGNEKIANRLASFKIGSLAS